MKTVTLELSDEQLAALNRMIDANEDDVSYSKMDWEVAREVLWEITDRVEITISSGGVSVERGHSMSREMLEKAKRIAARNGKTLDEVADFLIEREFARVTAAA